VSRRTIQVDPSYSHNTYTERGKSPEPLRGNQLAQALARVATPVPESAPVSVEAPAEKPVEEEEAVVSQHQPHTRYDLTEIAGAIQQWLIHLAAGNRMPVHAISDSIPRHVLRSYVERFVAMGLVAMLRGPAGGTVATRKLIALAQSGATFELNDVLAIMKAEQPPPIPDVEIGVSDTDTDTDTAAAAAVPPPYTPSKDPVPSTYAGKRQRILDDVRRWLHACADGQRPPIYRITIAAETSRLGKKLREAGLIERHEQIGTGMNGPGVLWQIPETMQTFVREMTDEQLSDVLWGGGLTPAAMPSLTSASPEETLTTPAAMPTAAVEDPFAVIAERLTQIVDVLVRLDKRFHRIERDLGLKPIEEDES